MTLKPGQLIKIREGMEDDDIPADRRVGLLIRKHIREEGVWAVNINGKTLIFNEEWILPYCSDDQSSSQ